MKVYNSFNEMFNAVVPYFVCNDKVDVNMSVQDIGRHFIEEFTKQKDLFLKYGKEHPEAKDDLKVKKQLISNITKLNEQLIDTAESFYNSDKYTAEDYPLLKKVWEWYSKSVLWLGDQFGCRSEVKCDYPPPPPPVLDLRKK